MKRRVVGRTVYAAVALALPAMVKAGSVTLVDNGSAKCAIYASAQELSNAVIKASVDDLSQCLQKMSGATVPVHARAPGKEDRGLAPILVGDHAARQFGPAKKTCPSKQGWRLVASKTSLGMIGESPSGISYAIYELLDRLGCRWYMPSDMGEVIPAMKTVAVETMDVSETPATIYRNIWYADESFKRRNRLGGSNLAAAHAVPGDICRGDPAVAKGWASHIIASLNKQYTPTVSLSPADTISFCQCPKCKALDAGDYDPSMNCISLSDRMVRFGNAIVGEVTKEYPDVMFGMLAYVQYTRPPVREKPLPNLVPQIAPITYCRAHSMCNTNCPSRSSLKPIVEGWGRISKNFSMYHYGYNLAEVSCPYPMIRMWSDELRVCYSNHLTYWAPETMPNFASALPGLHLGIRMSWHTQADPAAILSEFYANFYGAAAVPMRRHWECIDDAWAVTPDHSGSGFGHLKRFTPQVMKTAREALNEAATACKTDMERRRVKMVDDSFAEFELFMKMRRDQAEGRLATLAPDAAQWQANWGKLMSEYGSQYGFSPYAQRYFLKFLRAYQDGTRIATNCAVLPVLSEWRYAVDREKKGEGLGWSKPETDDAQWPATNPGMETWGGMGIEYSFYGPVWYRTRAKIPAVSAGKKIHLWVSSTDGSAKVFVNGTHVPFVNGNGQKQDAFEGYCQPVSLDITSAVRPNAENQFTILGMKSAYLNEMGTGGLIGPVMVYHER